MRKPLCLVFVCQRLPQSCSLPLSSLLLSSCFCRLLSLTLSPSHPHSACLRAAHCYNYTLLPPSLLLLIAFCLSPPHPHTLIRVHMCYHNLNHQLNIHMCSPHTPTPSHYVSYPSHPLTVTPSYVYTPLPSHPHTLTLSYPSHPLAVTPSFIPLPPTPSHPHRYVLLSSGLNLGSSWSDQLSVELLVDYITGQLGGEEVGVAKQVHEPP